MSNFCSPSQVRKLLEIWASRSDESGRFRPWGKWSSNSRHFQACSRHQHESWSTNRKNAVGFSDYLDAKLRAICPPYKGIIKCFNRESISLSLSFASTINSPSLGNGDKVISDFFFWAVLFPRNLFYIDHLTSFTSLSSSCTTVPPFMPFIREAGPKRSPQWTSTKCLGHGGK